MLYLLTLLVKSEGLLNGVHRENLSTIDENTTLGKEHQLFFLEAAVAHTHKGKGTLILLRLNLLLILL